MKIKTIQISPHIGQHDLDTKLRHARKFLTKGNKVRINLRFKGRQMAHQDLGMDRVKEALETLTDISIIESPPKKAGYEINAMLAPTRSTLDRIKREKK